ncbi:MAG: FAD:protein FMN transferase [Thiohalobacterales bacterium]
MVLLLITGCERKPGIHEDTLNVLGTFAQISIVGMTPKAAGKAARAAEADLKALDTIGYTLEQEGELQRLNAAIANRRTVEISKELLELIQHARRLSMASQNLFNPAAGELTALWEFHCDSAECTEVPYPDEVQRLVREQQQRVIDNHPSMDDLVIHRNRIHSRNRFVRLEFGDIIRGLALDKSLEHLKRAGVENAMVDIGGSVKTTGTRGDHAWWIGIPDATGKRHLGYIETNGDEAVFTAQALGRSFGKQDFVYRHVVDPRTGIPVSRIQSVTIAHKSAMTANAAAAALMVAGMEGWKTIADSMDVHAFILITRDGTIYTTPAIEDRIHWKQGIAHSHLVP